MEQNSRPLFALTKEEFIEIFDARYQKIIQVPTNPEISNDELLTLNEVCKLFKKTRQTINNWKKRGLIKQLKVEGSNYYSKQEIEVLLKKAFTGFSIKIKN